jgi:hypothetical protein
LLGANKSFDTIERFKSDDYLFLDKIMATNKTSSFMHLDFNDLKALNLLSEELSAKFKKIIIDVSTIKFANWNIAHLKIFSNLLTKGGKLYLDADFSMHSIFFETTNAKFSNRVENCAEFYQEVLRSIEDKTYFTEYENQFMTLGAAQCLKNGQIGDISAYDKINAAIKEHNRELIKSSDFSEVVLHNSIKTDYPLQPHPQWKVKTWFEATK